MKYSHTLHVLSFFVWRLLITPSIVLTSLEQDAQIVRTDGQYVYLILILNATVGTYVQRQKPQKFKWIWIRLYWDL